MVKGIDTAARLTVAQAKALKAAGYEFAGRYLVPAAWGKALTKAEAELITGAGMRLLTVWETYGERAKGGAAAGAADGAAARQCAQAVGMPAQGIIYFAVDFGAQAGDMAAIEAYLRAARANTGPYEIGVYGPYNVIEYMAERQVCKAYWQCVGWSGGKHSKYRDVYQATFQQLVAGVLVDINECDDLDAAGIWDYESEEAENVTRYNTMAELPSWAQPTVEKLIRMGAIQGSGASLDADGNPTDMDLSHDMVRLLVINDRAGAYGKR